MSIFAQQPHTSGPSGIIHHNVGGALITHRRRPFNSHLAENPFEAVQVQASIAAGSSATVAVIGGRPFAATVSGLSALACVFVLGRPCSAAIGGASTVACAVALGRPIAATVLAGSSMVVVLSVARRGGPFAVKIISASRRGLMLGSAARRFVKVS